jgi:DNA invertase Pin-like site-specific DNA recombinase
MQALSYLRVSSRGQLDGDGFERQRIAVARYAKVEGYTVVGEFAESTSGVNELSEREALGELLDRIDSNGVRVVIVERADRLARDLVVGELLLAEFRRRDVRVLSAEGGVDLTAVDDPTSKLIRQVLGAVAEFEKSVLVAKMRAARDRRSKVAGRRVEGRKRYGHTKAEQVVLGRVRELRRKPRGSTRRSWTAVAAVLNAEGLVAREGQAWNAGTLHRIGRREGVR